MNKIIELKINKGERSVTQTITGFSPEIKGLHIQKDLKSDFSKIGFNCSLTLKVFVKQNEDLQKYVYNFPSFNDNKYNIDIDFKHLNHLIVHSIEATINNCTLTECNCRLVIRQGGALINLQNPLELFGEHLDNDSNTKIVLSGKFGQGKTTFLNHFFENQNVYDVLTVYPVNYSVATNEDIFKYIKADILFQLLGKDVEFDVSKMSYGQALQEFLLVRPKYVIANVIKAGLKLNKATSYLVGAFEQLEKIHDKIVEYQGGNTENDEESARSFISTVFEEEGSIYDDNFYTQLIRQLLEQVKVNSSKQTVLVIEDLDRMDPDHIFRILNVVSAHYDTYMHSVDISYHNKFGFDKIILVCDIDNIRNIFHHKYGEHTDFDGYFNKYFSSAPFRYDNNAMVKHAIRNVLLGEDESGDALQYNALIDLLELLVVNNQLKLRELIKLKNIPFKEFKGKLAKDNFEECRCSLFYTIIEYLKIYLSDHLTVRIEGITLMADDKNIIGNYCDFLIGAKAGRATNFSYSIRNLLYNVEVMHGSYNSSYNRATKYMSNGNEEKIDFTLEDFKRLLIELC